MVQVEVGWPLKKPKLISAKSKTVQGLLERFSPKARSVSKKAVRSVARKASLAAVVA